MITLDTGALIALERKHARMLRIIAAVSAANGTITVPTAVVTEWWRGRPSARMAKLFEGVVLEPLDARLARLAGEAIGAVRGATAIDAIVVASAAQRGDTVFTSDVDDLTRLCSFFRGVRILHA
jgi:predicted nucleic acid-binding protein